MLSPILVRRCTNQVIDGVHRLIAARRRGQETIALRYFDGDEASAFVLAVSMNVAHGRLPLCHWPTAREAAHAYHRHALLLVGPEHRGPRQLAGQTWTRRRRGSACVAGP